MKKKKYILNNIDKITRNELSKDEKDYIYGHINLRIQLENDGILFTKDFYDLFVTKKEESTEILPLVQTETGDDTKTKKPSIITILINSHGEFIKTELDTTHAANTLIYSTTQFGCTITNSVYVNHDTLKNSIDSYFGANNKPTDVIKNLNKKLFQDFNFEDAVVNDSEIQTNFQIAQEIVRDKIFSYQSYKYDKVFEPLFKDGKIVSICSVMNILNNHGKHDMSEIENELNSLLIGSYIRLSQILQILYGEKYKFDHVFIIDYSCSGCDDTEICVKETIINHNENGEKLLEEIKVKTDETFGGKNKTHKKIKNKIKNLQKKNKINKKITKKKQNKVK